MGSFIAGLEVISEKVGHGIIEGVLEFNQVYASAQHELTWFSGPLAGHVIRNHPHGGGGHFISGPMLEAAPAFMQTVADHVLDEGTVAGVAQAMEEWGDLASAAAPIEFGDLRESAHPQVFEDGALVYDRPPIVGRLSKEQLKAKEKAAERGDYRRDYLSPDHPMHGTLHQIHGGTHTEATKPPPTVGG